MTPKRKTDVGYTCLIAWATFFSYKILERSGYLLARRKHWKKKKAGGSDPQEELFLLLDERLRLPRKGKDTSNTTLNKPFLPALDLQDLRGALHASSEFRSFSASVGENVLEAPEGANSELTGASELTAREVQSSQSTRGTNALAIAVFVGSSVLGAIVILNTLVQQLKCSFRL